jgi:hypothetical protein
MHIDAHSTTLASIWCSNNKMKEKLIIHGQHFQSAKISRSKNGNSRQGRKVELGAGDLLAIGLLVGAE